MQNTSFDVLYPDISRGFGMRCNLQKKSQKKLILQNFNIYIYI